MRVFFAILALSLTVPCHGATPSYSSFDQVYFTTNNRVVSLRTNLISTNSITTLYVTNLYASNFFSTNITVNNITVTTNITVGGTNVALLTDLLWTNISGTIQPTKGIQVLVTNLTSVHSLTSEGSTHLKGLSSSNLVIGSNNLNAYQVGTFLLTGPTTTPTDTRLKLATGIGYQLLVIQNFSTNSAFSFRNGEPLWDDPSSVVHLRGDWETSSKGDTLILYQNGFYWSEWDRQWANTNVVSPVVMNPTDLYLPVRRSAGVFADSPLHIPSVGSTNTIIDGQLLWGPGTTNALYRSSNDLVYTNQNAFGTFLRVSSDGSNFASYGANGNVAKITGPAAIYMQATPSADYAVLTTVALVSGTPGFLSLGTSANQWNSLHLTNQIVWGPGTTNALFRNGTSLVYQNGYVGGTTNEIFALRNGTTNRYVFMSDFPASGANGLNIYGQNGVNSVTFGTKLDGIDAHVTADTGGAVWISPSRQSSGSYAFVTTGFVPDTDGKNIGTITNPWGDSSQTGTHYIYGHRSGTGYTNYSRFEFSHTGTNGLANINSSSANDAGSPRAINFQIGGTNQVRIDSSASAGQTRFWLYDEDNGTMERVTVGAADSGGAGFKLLRIPN